MKLIRLLSSLAVAALLNTAPARAALIPVTSDIAAGTTVTWTADNEYLLNTVVYVQDGATLIIEPGTVIKGGTDAANLVGRQDIPNLVSALWVTRGGKIMAEGTKENPIIFTMEGDDVNDPDDVPPTLTGQWGGIVIMGRARLNTATDAAGNVADPKFDLYEGVDGPGPNFEHAFGGNDDDDNSGVLRYVSIRHTGNVFAPARELNSLSLGAVGRGTTLEHVESFASSDDGFEFWGGTVNTKWLVSAFIEDDDFDTDQGYSGVNQFWFGIKPPWNGSSDSRAFETDGDLNQNVEGEEPLSQWQVYNATLIGRGPSDAGFGGGVAWNPRDETAPRVYNSVFTDFAEGVRLDNDGRLHFNSGLAGAWNNVWNVTLNGNANAQFLFTTAEFNNTETDPLLGGISYANDGGLDPRPQTGSPALSGAAPVPEGLVQTEYRGAFAPNSNWADGWTALSAHGFLKVAPEMPGAPEIGVVSVSGNQFMLSLATQAGRSYQLQSTDDLGASPIVWVDEGEAMAGTGELLVIAVEIEPGSFRFFRIVSQ